MFASNGAHLLFDDAAGVFFRLVFFDQLTHIICLVFFNQLAHIILLGVLRILGLGVGLKLLHPIANRVGLPHLNILLHLLLFSPFFCQIRYLCRSINVIKLLAVHDYVVAF